METQNEREENSETSKRLSMSKPLDFYGPTMFWYTKEPIKLSVTEICAQQDHEKNMERV